MPEKTTKAGRKYFTTGRKFSWFPLDDDDVPKEQALVIPLRLKLGTVLDLQATGDIDAAAMMEMIQRIVPGYDDALRDMDLNDFQEMFVTWQTEYQAMSGASLGESSGSSI